MCYTCKCVIHYKHLDETNDSLTALNRQTLKKLKESKDARNSLGGDHVHNKQINGVPEMLDPDKHGAHCVFYQKFANAMSVLKLRTSFSDIPQKRQRRSGEFTGTIFPAYCVKCKSSKALTVKGKKQLPKNLTLTSACKQVKRAARLHNDDERLHIIAEEHLMAKEFKMHENCHREYTRIHLHKRDIDNGRQTRK